EVVFDLRAPDELGDVRLQEERVAEAEARRETDSRVRRQIGRVRGARPGLARIRQVQFVQLVAGEGGEEIGVANVDAGRIALRAVGGCAVRRNVEGFVLLPRVVEGVRG